MRDRCDHILCDPVHEIVLAGVAPESLERKHEEDPRPGCRIRGLVRRHDGVPHHRAVVERSTVGEGERQVVRHLAVDVVGEPDATGLGLLLDLVGTPVGVALISTHDPDAIVHAPLLGRGGIACRHQRLHLAGTAHRLGR